MATCSLDIRIGATGNQNKQLYKSIDVTIEMHQQKINKISQQFSTLLGKTVIPFIVIELPQLNLENNQIFNFKSHDYDSSFAKVNNKVYQYCNPRNKDTIKLLKNVEKQFQKVTKLNNLCNLKVSLYDSLREHQPQDKLLLLNSSKIKANFQGDTDLIPNLTEIIRRISNQFLNSPFMAFIQLLQNANLKLNLESVENFSEEIKHSYLSWLNFSTWINKDKIHELIKAKGDLIIHITLPKLLSIKIKGQAAVFGTFLSIFP